MSQSFNNWLKSRDPWLVVGGGVLVSLVVRGLLGSSFATTDASISGDPLAVLFLGVAVILVVLVRHLDVSSTGRVFVLSTAVFSIFSMLLWLSGNVMTAVPFAIFTLTMTLVSYMGLIMDVFGFET